MLNFEKNYCDFINFANTFPNTRTEDVDLFLGRRVDDEVSKHTGTVISCGNMTLIDCAISGSSPGHLWANYTMCIYPKDVNYRTTRRRCWWCYHNNDRNEWYTRWYCKVSDYVPLYPDGSGRERDRFCCKEHVKAGGIIKVEDPNNIEKN